MAEGKSKNVYTVIGEDDYIVGLKAQAFIDSAVPKDLRNTAVEIIEGTGTNAETMMASLNACKASLQAPPFLDPVKLTWWRDVGFLPGGAGKEASEEVKDALAKFADYIAGNKLPPNQFLLITGPKILQTSVVAKRLAAAGEMLVFAPTKNSRDKQAAMRPLFEDFAKEAGLKFEPKAASLFLSKVSSGARVMISEIEKLRTYIGPDRNEVKEEDVKAITSTSCDEPEIWALNDAIIARNAKGLMNAWRSLSATNGAQIAVANILERFFRELIYCRDAIDAGLLSYNGWSQSLPEDEVEAINSIGIGPGNPPWKLRKLVQQASQFNLRDLRAAHFRLVRFREKLVSGQVDGNAIEIELMKIMPRAGVRK